jgi:hypothetical protein
MMIYMTDEARDRFIRFMLFTAPLVGTAAGVWSGGFGLTLQ